MNNKTFKLIVNFVKELNELFGKSQLSLCLYNRLIEKTTLLHAKPIQKHIDVFKDFCIKNRESIISKDITKMNVSTISYSEKVYINMLSIFKLADTDTTNTIWKYLLTISALLDPESKAKNMLVKAELPKTNEMNFLTNIMNKVEENFDPNISNPMEMVGTMLSSGLFTELIGEMSNGLSSGNLNVSNLMNSVQTMLTSMNVDKDMFENIKSEVKITEIEEKIQEMVETNPIMNLSAEPSIESSAEPCTEPTTVESTTD